MEASEWSVSLPLSRAHTPLSRCLCMPLCPLVYFQSTDQPLTDRRPIRILLSPSMVERLKGPDSCSEIPTVPGKSHRISHWIPYLRQRERGEQWERKNERQVRHLVRVKEGKHKEGKAEREWQRPSKTQSVWVFVSLSTCCLQGDTVADIKDGTWVFLKPKPIPTDRPESPLWTQSVRILCISQWQKLKISDVENCVHSWISAVVLPFRLSFPLSSLQGYPVL